MAKVSRYSSYRTMTAYEAVTAWTAKRKAMRQEFEGRQSAANNAFIECRGVEDRRHGHDRRPNRA